MKKITLLSLGLIFSAFSFAQTVTHTAITSGGVLYDAAGKAIGLETIPAPPYTLTVTGVTGGATSYQVFNQFRKNDSSGAQFAGGGV